MAMSAKERKRANRIAEIQKALKCTEEEAIDVYETDYAIDHGQRTPYDLSPEEEKAAIKNWTSAGYKRTKAEIGEKAKPQIQNVELPTKKAPPVYKFEGKTERPKNEIKCSIIAELLEFLLENNEKIGFSNVEVVTVGKKIQFDVGNDTFTLDLVQKRKPKV